MTDDVENTSHITFMQDVLTRQPCPKHRVHKGTACWYLWTLLGKKTPAVCNARARKAGFRGAVTAQATRRSYVGARG